MDGGPIHEGFAALCAEYCAHTRERFVPDRRSSRGESRTRFELNVGVSPRPGLVPFGCPGWAFVPESLRRKRGRPKYERAEPVLCVGYQHMYTRVYKCLTRHGSVIHSEQVNWDMEAPLGLFPTLMVTRLAPSRY